MLTDVHPKLPMRDKLITCDFYINKLAFQQSGGDYADYLMLQKDNIAIHFFLFRELDPNENYGQVYIRTDNIREWHEFAKTRGVKTTKLEHKAWGQAEFSIVDPDNNLLTFGQPSV